MLLTVKKLFFQIWNGKIRVSKLLGRTNLHNRDLTAPDSSSKSSNIFPPFTLSFLKILYGKYLRWFYILWLPLHFFSTFQSLRIFVKTCPNMVKRFEIMSTHKKVFRKNLEAVSRPSNASNFISIKCQVSFVKFLLSISITQFLTIHSSSFG